MFPGDALRILQPSLVRLGVAAQGSMLLDAGEPGLVEARFQRRELILGIDLQTQVIEAHLRAALVARDGEVDPKGLQHPFA